MVVQKDVVTVGQLCTAMTVHYLKMLRQQLALKAQMVRHKHNLHILLVYASHVRGDIFACMQVLQLLT